MDRITITLTATIDLPRGMPSRDYQRAVGNRLCDLLDATQLDVDGRQPAALASDWKPGREVSIAIAADLARAVSPALPTGDPGDLATLAQGSLL